ncbi:MAG TPA: M14 family metallopeptidase [Steroidobacteraceae bacterium]|nr:M14 family metallopeptidase [Steroidobacteraceae bacterium]
MIESFSEDYAEARQKFLAAAGRAGAQTTRYSLDQRGPDGTELSVDVARVGPSDSGNVLVTISGTHGVEGFFGSATQIEWLNRASTEPPLPQEVAVVHIHAINPYGFAWLRRTNEDNVDINRNWIDFKQPLPTNPLYNELADDLCPSDWSQQSQAQTGARMMAWISGHGPAVYQAAVSAGQWQHPSGLFYGGTHPSWSRQTLEAILTWNLQEASRVCILDFHTGLGPYGYAEPIIGRARTDPGFARTRAWMGAAAKSLFGDGSVSSEIKGESSSAIPALVPHAQVDIVALECGIRPITDVALALRADAWLHAHGDPLAVEAKPIKALIRAAFHSDEPIWQGMALGQGLAACKAALGGLSANPEVTS